MGSVQTKFSGSIRPVAYSDSKKIGHLPLMIFMELMFALNEDTSADSRPRDSVDVTRFNELETVIERGQKTFIEVGLALAEIRDSRLYRQEFATFEDYCKERWGWERRYSYQLIESATAVEEMCAIVHIEEVLPPVRNEAQARELAKIPDPEVRDYMTECNNKFAFFEMKTAGARMSYGQSLALERLLRCLKDSAILFVVEHPRVDRVTLPPQVVSFSIWSCWKGELRTHGPISGHMFSVAYKAFFTWAETGDCSDLKRIVSMHVITHPQGLGMVA